MKFLNVLAVTSLFLCLSACGGGSSKPAPTADAPSSDAPTADALEAGIFDVNYGQFYGTYAFLKNGEFYGIHYVGNGILAGHPRGTLPAGNAVNNRTAIAWANFIDDGARLGAQELNPSFGRTFNTGNVEVSISGGFGLFSTSSGNQKPWISGSSSTLYFDPIPLATLAGNYDGIMRSVGIEEPIQDVTGLRFDAFGNFSTTVSNCTYTGSISQYGTTGVYNASATASGSECTMATTLTGLLMPISYENEMPEIALMLNSGDEEYTAVFVVNKQ